MSTCHRRCPDDECHAAGYPGCAFGSDDNLTPVARACIANARRALAAANGTLTPDRRPYVPPEPETPAERVQGTATTSQDMA